MRGVMDGGRCGGSWREAGRPTMRWSEAGRPTLGVLCPVAPCTVLLPSCHRHSVCARQGEGAEAHNKRCAPAASRRAASAGAPSPCGGASSARPALLARSAFASFARATPAAWVGGVSSQGWKRLERTQRETAWGEERGAQSQGCTASDQPGPTARSPLAQD